MNRQLRLRVVAAMFAAMTVCGLAQAQAFPSRAIRLYVPGGSGGAPDVMTRLVAQAMSVTLGQQVLVENRPGGSGVIAMEPVVRAPPDGYQVFVGDISHYAINPVLQPGLTIDFNRDLAPVSLAVTGPLFLVVNAALGVSSVQELIALAKTRPGMNYGSPGNASVHQLGVEQFALLAGVKFTHIPFKGVAPAIPALLSGDTQLMLLSPPALGSNVRNGRLRILAVAAAQRTPLMPEMTTVAEAGFPGFEAVTSVGFFVPAATPAPVIARLHAEFVRALKSPEVEPKMSGLGVIAIGSTPAEYAERIRIDRENYARLVRAIGLKVD